jgi:hypothetical protein
MVGSRLAIRNQVRRRGAFTIAVVIVGATGSARADSIYWGAGFGAARLDGDLDRVFDTSGEIGGRILAGFRRGDTAIETSFFGTDLHYADAVSIDGTHSTLSLGIGVKQHVRLMRHLEIYGRAGLDYTWLAGCPGKPALPPLGYSGPGYDLGTGVVVDWHFAMPRGRIDSFGVSLWLDAGLQRMRLTSDEGKPLTGGMSAVNAGFSFDVTW